MYKISGLQFKELTIKDPSWCSKLTQDIEVSTYCNMQSSKITHLSPFIHFKGIDSAGWTADFSFCSNLKIATGKFYGGVSFQNSNIIKIENLIVYKNTNEGNAAVFDYCNNLEIAEGDFSGVVSFNASGVRGIETLIIKKSIRGRAASFANCHNLKIATGTFPGSVNFSGANIEKLGNLSIPFKNGAIASFVGCNNQLVLDKEIKALILRKTISRF